MRWVRATGALAIRLRLLLVALWTVPWTLDMFPRTPLASDWWFFEYGARELTGRLGGYTPIDGGVLHIYTWLPTLQIGPPALVAAAPLQLLDAFRQRLVAVVLMLLALLVVLVLLERIAAVCGLAMERVRVMTLVGGLLVVPGWCALSVFSMHLDDVIALTLGVAAVLQVLRGRWLWVALALGLAAATKPWAVAFFPLVLMLPPVRRAPTTLVAILTAGVWWLPFLLADPGAVQATGAHLVHVTADSTLALFGLSLTYGPERLGQLVLMVLVGWWLVRSGRWPALVVGVVAVRMLTDPQTWLYYTAGLAVGALLFDVVATSWRWPRLTTAAMALLLLESRVSQQVNGPVHQGQTVLAVVRALALLALLVYLFRSPPVVHREPAAGQEAGAAGQGASAAAPADGADADDEPVEAVPDRC